MSDSKSHRSRSTRGSGVSGTSSDLRSSSSSRNSKSSASRQSGLAAATERGLEKGSLVVRIACQSAGGDGNVGGRCDEIAKAGNDPFDGSVSFRFVASHPGEYIFTLTLEDAGPSSSSGSGSRGEDVTKLLEKLAIAMEGRDAERAKDLRSRLAKVGVECDAGGVPLEKDVLRVLGVSSGDASEHNDSEDSPRKGSPPQKGNSNSAPLPASSSPLRKTQSPLGIATPGSPGSLPRNPQVENSAPSNANPNPNPNPNANANASEVDSNGDDRAPPAIPARRGPGAPPSAGAGPMSSALPAPSRSRGGLGSLIAAGLPTTQGEESSSSISSSSSSAPPAHPPNPMSAGGVSLPTPGPRRNSVTGSATASSSLSSNSPSSPSASVPSNGPPSGPSGPGPGRGMQGGFRMPPPSVSRSVSHDQVGASHSNANPNGMGNNAAPPPSFRRTVTGGIGVGQGGLANPPPVHPDPQGPPGRLPMGRLAFLKGDVKSVLPARGTVARRPLPPPRRPEVLRGVRPLPPPRPRGVPALPGGSPSSQAPSGVGVQPGAPGRTIANPSRSLPQNAPNAPALPSRPIPRVPVVPNAPDGIHPTPSSVSPPSIAVTSPLTSTSPSESSPPVVTNPSPLSSVVSQSVSTRRDSNAPSTDGSGVARFSQGTIRSSSSMRTATSVADVERFRAELERDPKNPDLLHALGYALVHFSDKVSEGIRILEQALEADPDRVVVHFDLGVAHAKLESWEDSIRSYRKSLDADAKNVATLINLGNVFMQLKQDQDELDMYQKALHEEPDNSTALYNYGNVNLRLGKTQLAVDSFKKIVSLGEASAEVYVKLGQSCEVVGSLSNAVDAFREAVKLDEKNSDAWESLGSILEKTGDGAGAQKAYAQAVKSDAQNLTAHIAWGMVLFGSENGEEGSGVLVAALSKATKKPWFNSDGRMSGSQNQNQNQNQSSSLSSSQDVSQDLVEAVATVNALNQLGAWSKDSGDMEEAKKRFETAVVLLSSKLLMGASGDDRKSVVALSAAAHSNLGFVLQEQDLFLDASKHYRVALEMDRENAMTYNKLGTCLISLGETEDGIKTFMKGLEVSSHHPTILYNLAAAHAKQGDISNAVNRCRELMQFNPEFEPGKSMWAVLEQYA